MPGDPALAQVLALVRSTFAGMAGRVDPPSSVHLLTHRTLDDAARADEVWAIGVPVVACVTLTPKGGALYLGKLAVAEGARGQGLARRLVSLAVGRARALGLDRVQLQTRIELSKTTARSPRWGSPRSRAPRIRAMTGRRA